METFGFLIHPMDIDDVARKYKIAKKINPKVVERVVKRRRPLVVSQITGIRSITGKEATGWFIAVPFLPHQFFDLDQDYVIEKIAKACEIGRKEGARIVGLGAFTAIPGDGGRLVDEQTKVPITTGNTYTVVLAIEGALKAATLMGIDIKSSVLAVVGATGSIGSACAEVMADQVGEVILLGRDQNRLSELGDRIKSKNEQVKTSTSLSSISSADIIITVTGATDAIIDPDLIKPGAVVCDVARPRDVSELVVKRRKDVLVIDGGLAKVPGSLNFNFDYGLPQGMALGCMSETMILALEGRYESYTIGKNISLDKVTEMINLATKHGFELAGLRSFENELRDSYINRVRENARLRPVAAR